MPFRSTRFNPEVHLGLATAFETLGDAPGAVREKEIAQRLIHKK